MIAPHSQVQVRLPKGTRPRLFSSPSLALTESFRPCYYCSGHYRRKCAPNPVVRVVLPRNDAQPAAKARGNPRGRRAPGLSSRWTARKIPVRQEQPESTSLRPFVAPDGAPRDPRPHRLGVRFGRRVWICMRLDRSSVCSFLQSLHLRRVSMQWGWAVLMVLHKASRGARCHGVKQSCPTRTTDSFCAHALLSPDDRCTSDLQCDFGSCDGSTETPGVCV